MRYFKLENSVGGVMDITTQEILFHDIEGLGFEEEAEFRRVGPVWRMNDTAFTQLAVSGKVCFTELGSTTPYQKFEVFKEFISRTPLNLVYYPHGLGEKAYRKKVRVTKLAKTEMTKYGVIDSDISFTPYTPWYEVVYLENVPVEVDEDAHWIWDTGNEWRDTIDDSTGVPRYKFGSESRNAIDIECTSNAKGFIKLTIDGPAENPMWTQYVNNQLKATGGFDSSYDVDLLATECLVIDNTEGQFSMAIVNKQTGVQRNVYALRDFDRACFFAIEEGLNTIIVTSQDGSPLKIYVEGHMHYATV